MRMDPGLVTFGQNDIQAPAVNAVVYSTMLTTHTIAISSSSACSACASCRRNLDAYLTCVWLSEQTSAVARNWAGAGGSSSCTHYHAAMPAHLNVKDTENQHLENLAYWEKTKLKFVISVLDLVVKGLFHPSRGTRVLQCYEWNKLEQTDSAVREIIVIRKSNIVLTKE